MSTETFRLISEGILREILRKKQLLETIPGYHLKYSNGKKKALRKEANKHSISLELAGYETTTTVGRSEKSKEQNRCIKTLTNAVDWGLRNFPGELSGEFIKELGQKIEPDLNSDGYRRDRVKVLGAAWSPPSPEKLEREMRIFLNENGCLDNVIEKAVHSHFHIARIHPFIDGNGRTARTTQNIILECAGFFPASVKLSERLEYNHLLDKAVSSYRIAEGNLTDEQLTRLTLVYGILQKELVTPKEMEYCKELTISLGKARMGSEQNDFYNFMALKLRDTLKEESDYMQTELKKKKK